MNNLKQTLKEYEPFINKILSKYNIPVGFFDDLKQEAYIALIKAYKDYDPRKASFSTFAYSRVDGRVRNVLRRDLNLIKIPAYLVDKSYRYHNGKERGLSQAEEEQLKFVDSIFHESFEGSEIPYESYLGEETIAKIEEQMDAVSFMKLICRMLNPTSISDQTFIARYIDNKPMNIIAEEFNTTAGTVSKRVNDALRRLRKRIMRRGLRLQ